MTKIYKFKWDCGHGEVQSLAGMLGPVHFDMGDKKVQPFAIMPWGEDTGIQHDALPGILKRTRGEWPCVPFGAPVAPEELPENWKAPSPQFLGDDFHGFSANNHWQLMEKSEAKIHLGIDYPENSPISRLERIVQGVQGQTKINCQLSITARRDVNLPIALHPCFALSKDAGKTEISAQFEFGKVLPIETEPGVSRLSPDTEFTSLQNVPTKDGSICLRKLPLPFATEEIVQLCGTSGPVSLINHEAGYQVRLIYDQKLFPSMLLWVSNRGRSEYPWLSRFEGVGIEPLCGAFDLGPDVGNWSGNPIAKRGIATAITIKAGETIHTEYDICVDRISKGKA